MTRGIETITKTPVLRAPFTYFGGKMRVVDLVWPRLGNTPNYVEPFFGSGTVLLGRPEAGKIETVNDANGFIANFWRAIKTNPEAVAQWCDWPVNEADLHARRTWLRAQTDGLLQRLESDMDYHDSKIAGLWVWETCASIGGTSMSTCQHGIPHIGDAGRGINRLTVNVSEWFAALSARLRRVRVCCGDWARVCGDTVIGLKPRGHGRLPCAVFLDPPYEGYEDAYANSDSVSYAVRQWAIEHQDNPKLRIALCGYDGEHAMPDGWEEIAWKAHGGYGSQGDGRGRENSNRERLWFSPHCLRPEDKQEGLLC